MPDSRKIDGDQLTDGEHIALDGDKEFRNSRLSLSKDKASPDGAHEKLLHKEDEAKIVRDMRVDMVDAKFVSGDHRNGDPKIELDANKKFSGLTKEELMKYADDPFWVRLRWFMFVLFWALWVAMLAAAIFIIVKAPACPASAPRMWFEKGPLAELESSEYADVEKYLPLLRTSKVEAIFLSVPTYDALENPGVLDKFKAFVQKAKEYSVKVIVDLTPNYVSSEHRWFKLSENSTAPFTDYFKWANAKYDVASGNRTEPNAWVSVHNSAAWSYSAARDSYYLHQYEDSEPDLDFNNPAVVALFTDALTKWMQAGAGGVRLNKARLMLVNPSLGEEPQAKGQGPNGGAGHTDYDFYRHNETSDQPALVDLFAKFKDATVAASTLDTDKPVFTLKEDKAPELYTLKEQLALQPNSIAPLSAVDATAAAYINSRLNGTRPQGQWPILQLKSDDPDVAKELALFSAVLPATPVFNLDQLANDSSTHSLSHLLTLRSDESIQHGAHEVTAVPGRLDGGTDEATSEATGGAASGAADGMLLACARYKSGHTGYIAVYNPGAASLRANLTGVRSVPPSLTVHHVSAALRDNNYTTSTKTSSDNVLVPSKSTVVLSYVPLTTAAN